MDGFETHVRRPLTEPDVSVAVVGAGVSGATAARVLRNHGLPVDVYEKSRGSGGRSSTRRVERDEGPSFHLDHGAQYFTAGAPVFRRFVQSGVRRGALSVWSPQIGVLEEGTMRMKEGDTRRFVAVPGMSSLADLLLDDVTPEYRSRVEALRSDDEHVFVRTETETHGPYDAVIVTAPPPQSADMIEGLWPEGAAACRSVLMVPVWALLLGFEQPVPIDADAVFLDTDTLRWTARNTSKPGRTGGESWVAHAASGWSARHLEEESPAVAEALLEEWYRCLDVSPERTPSYLSAHRWRYARAEEPADETVLASPGERVVLAGDWLCSNRIEGAFRSGRVAASRVLHGLTRRVLRTSCGGGA